MSDDKLHWGPMKERFLLHMVWHPSHTYTHSYIGITAFRISHDLVTHQRHFLLTNWALSHGLENTRTTQKNIKVDL